MKVSTEWRDPRYLNHAEYQVLAPRRRCLAPRTPGGAILAESKVKSRDGVKRFCGPDGGGLGGTHNSAEGRDTPELVLE